TQSVLGRTRRCTGPQEQNAVRGAEVHGGSRRETDRELLMPKVQANGIDIFYEVRGTGDPLLLIAGFACDHTIWSQVVPAIGAHYRVVVCDNRGVGRTSSPDAATSIRQMAEDAAGLLDAIGLGPAHVAGHSMGGLIAQELVLAHPEQVQSLMILSSCARV